MRTFLPLLRRETRDARWHLVAAAVLGAVIPWAVRHWALDGADPELVASVGARAVVPLLFAFFVAATASELVARDVATRRIEGLALLPVSIGRVWTAKATFLALASALFLAWLVAAQWATLAFEGPAAALALLPRALGDAVPSLCGAVALGGIALFFSTLVERGMAAGLGAFVVIIAAAAGLHWAAVPATPGVVANVAFLATPLVIAAAFVVASRIAFVRGPIQAATKLRLAYVGAVAAALVLLPGGAALAWGVEAATKVAAGEGDPSEREIDVSPDGKWVAVEERRAPRVFDEASRVWLVGVADGSCREVVDGRAHLLIDGSWTGGSMLRVVTSQFSYFAGPCFTTEREVEPTRLETADEAWMHFDPVNRTQWSPDWGQLRLAQQVSPRRATFEVSWVGHGPKKLTGRLAALGGEAAVAFVVDENDAIFRICLDGRPGKELTKFHGDEILPSRNGLRLLLVEPTGVRVIDAATGEALFDGPPGRARWLDDGTAVQTFTEDWRHDVAATSVVEIDAHRTIALGRPHIPERLPRVCVLADGRLVVSDAEVTLVGTDGKTLSRLFPPEGAKGGGR